jgi:hypothetical protein
VAASAAADIETRKKARRGLMHAGSARGMQRVSPVETDEPTRLARRRIGTSARGIPPGPQSASPS